MNRAYSTFEVKAIDEDKRIITGIATTPTPDRVGDIVEPEGAQFKLPLPLLWQHNSSQPIGSVIKARVTKDGIEVSAQIAKIDEAGTLKNRLDEAWQSIKSGLVRGFSIGFRSLEEAFMQDSYAYRFLKWEWLELSAVTIPANADASIQTIKSIDMRTRAALGIKDTRVVRLALPPGASGHIAAKRQEIDMKTFAEQIKDWQDKKSANVSRQEALMKAAAESGQTLVDKDATEFDTLTEENKTIDAHIARLQPLAEANKAAATQVDNDSVRHVPAQSGARATINAKLEPGVKFARMAMALARAKALQLEGRMVSADAIYKADKRWMDTAPEVELALKTAVNANDSTTAGNASEWAYAQNIATEFVEYLRPRTLLGKIPGWRNIPFNARVGGMNTGTSGYWVGQGAAITPSKPGSTSISLGITKVAGLSVIDKELARLSTPSAEMMVRNDLARALQNKADVSLIDPNSGGVANVQPASLTYAATARQASGTDYAAFKADVKSICATMLTANLSISDCVWIMTENMAQALSLMVTSLGNPQFPGLGITGGQLLGLPVFTTQAAVVTGSPDFSQMLILLNPSEVFLADDGGASVEASDQVSIHMDDASTMKSTATATGASLVSMFQTESIAIKAVRYVNWTKARAEACQFIRSAAYV